MCVCHHCLGEEQDKLESPQFLPEISGLLLARGWNENFPPQSGGGCCPPSLPSSSDCPPVFRVGVLVTANMCMGLAGWWGSSPFSRALSPEREGEREKERERVQDIPFLGEMIEEGSSLLKWHSFRGLRVQPLNLPRRGECPQTLPPYTPGFLCGGEPRRSKLWCERVGEMLGVGVLVF